MKMGQLGLYFKFNMHNNNVLLVKCVISVQAKFELNVVTGSITSLIEHCS